MIEPANAIGGGFEDHLTALRGELDAKGAQVLGVESTLDETLVFETAQQGADGVAADALGVAE